jgi:putative tryptophan/tyrosine transport system substrate-binding protein
LTYSDSSERFSKEVDVLREAVGPISRIAILWDLDVEYYRQSWSPAIQRAAGQLGLDILGPFQVRNATDFPGAFSAMMEQRAEAVLLSAGSVAFANRTRIGELSILHRLPIIGAFKEFPQAGTLISYGPNITAIFRRAAAFVGKILRGSNPGELPVENPTAYELVINLKTANALGLTIPPALLIRADEVIE